MSFRKFPDGSTLGGVRRSVALCALLSMPGVARGQSPRAANPERPTFATHAYTVAPGYIELEQGGGVRGGRAAAPAHSLRRRRDRRRALRVHRRGLGAFSRRW